MLALGAGARMPAWQRRWLHCSGKGTHLEVEDVAVVHGRRVEGERRALLAESQVVREVSRCGSVIILRRVLSCVEQQPLWVATMSGLMLSVAAVAVR